MPFTGMDDRLGGSVIDSLLVVRLANDVVVCVDGVKLVAVQDEGFARALCLNSEELREEVGRVEVRRCRLFGFQKGLFFFGFLTVIGDRDKVRKLQFVSYLRKKSPVGPGACIARGSHKSYVTRCRLYPIRRQGPISWRSEAIGTSMSSGSRKSAIPLKSWEHWLAIDAT